MIFASFEKNQSAARALAATSHPSVAAPEPTGIAFLSASSGGGHDAVAAAIGALLAEAHGDALPHQTVDLYRRGAVRGLPALARIRYHSDRLWRAFYRGTDHRSVVHALAAVLRRWATRIVKRQIVGTPRYLVAVHFVTAHALEPLARSYAVRPRTAIVMTDYEPHWAWFAPADFYVVASDEVEDRARRAGIARSRILRIPMLPARRASAPRGERHVQPEDRLRVVAVAGADGTSARSLIALLRALDAIRSGDRIEVSAICGRGQALQAALTALAGELTRVKLAVHGFVRDVPDRMAHADVVLLRAGGASISEVLASGTPAAVFDWHVHESRNAAMVERYGTGIKSRNAAEIASFVARLVEDPAARTALQRRARAVADMAPTARSFAPLFGPRADGPRGRSLRLPPVACAVKP